jgi:hypothetical protein
LGVGILELPVRLKLKNATYASERRTIRGSWNHGHCRYWRE